MKIIQALFSVKGTITRKEWWIYTLIVFILFYVGIFAFGISGMVLENYLTKTYTAGIIFGFSIYGMSILALWCTIALNIKRLRERKKKWGSIIILNLLYYTFYITILYIPRAINDAVYIKNLYPIITCSALFVLGLWSIIQLGFIKGTYPAKVTTDTKVQLLGS